MKRRICLVILVLSAVESVNAMPILNRAGCEVKLESLTPEEMAIIDQTDNLSLILKSALNAKLIDPYKLGHYYLRAVRSKTGEFPIFFTTSFQNEVRMQMPADDSGRRRWTTLGMQICYNSMNLRRQVDYFYSTHPFLVSRLSEQWRFTVRKLVFESLGLDTREGDISLMDAVDQAGLLLPD